MKTKLGIIGIISFLVLASFASAWHCTDTDQSKPQLNASRGLYGSWGDDAAMGGMAYGWMNEFTGEQNLPAGCSGHSIDDIECQDTCINNYTLREFYCTDKIPYIIYGDTIISYHDYENSEICGYQPPIVPEFSPIYAIVAVMGALAAFFVIRRF